MSNGNDTPDVSCLLKPLDGETLEEARHRIIEEVMAEHQIVSSAWSLIDGPFAQAHSIEDHAIALDEFRALIGQVVHLPASVEGIRFLENWHSNRMEQVEQLLTAAIPGNSLVIGEGSEPFVMTADFAKGMRASLQVVKGLFGKFPLTLTAGEG